MKKIFIIILCFFIAFLLTSCKQQQKEPEVDPREREVVQLVVHDKFDEAIIRANELYEGKELEEMVDWINKHIDINKNRQKQIQSLYPSRKLEIQSGYTHEIRNDYVYITGRVKNISDSKIRYFEVRVDFKDSNGNVLDSNYTNDGLTLNPGDMREFKIMHRWNNDYKKYSLSIDGVK